MIVTDVFAPEAINPLGVYVNFSKWRTCGSGSRTLNAASPADTLVTWITNDLDCPGRSQKITAEGWQRNAEELLRCDDITVCVWIAQGMSNVFSFLRWDDANFLAPSRSDAWLDTIGLATGNFWVFVLSLFVVEAFRWWGRGMVVGQGYLVIIVTARPCIKVYLLTSFFASAPFPRAGTWVGEGRRCSLEEVRVASCKSAATWVVVFAGVVFWKHIVKGSLQR